ncbi:NAD(P)-dependent alcohol dehydrogenase [Pseudomonas sp. N040]|uniref:NAD(P)-dependent alcohol dehydrogenase n=1 Tax=Pseudomonas sp. N040 TaxID=2785325 RepID=UPI0018A2AC0F|nr:NAD(P)-dependent alcohol dehydrogenase [Pseudomonas sp. N040]MBF7729117.1 NAD(P)-dependent alcohol dehydrogenase [Pseudomonas sp. N040]MBW7012757.1 NAD(P)-dependent alcohol dehydrogenase [Pseudomonas sp. N040]
MFTIGYAAQSAGAPLAPFKLQRRALRPADVALEILYCGVCHSDLHNVRNDWGISRYPMVPGHEIIGRVIAVGSAVRRYKIGDAVAVGCMIDSCLDCQHCHHGDQQFCLHGRTDTYNAPDRLSGENTLGGYSRHMVVREEFVLRVPAGLDLARAAPLLCAGITTYAPLRTWKVGPGSRVGVLGLGGLGHMAVKLAVGLGAEVSVLSRSADKQSDALALGAERLLVSTDARAMAAAAAGFDLIIDTIPVKHDINPYLPLLQVDGTLVLVGQVGPLAELSSVPLLMGRRNIAGSLIGGIEQTQEMLDFCARKNILPDCEMIGMEQINEAFERLERADVRYRFVIDMASLAAPCP